MTSLARILQVLFRNLLCSLPRLNELKATAMCQVYYETTLCLCARGVNCPSSHAGTKLFAVNTLKFHKRDKSLARFRLNLSKSCTSHIERDGSSAIPSHYCPDATLVTGPAFSHDLCGICSRNFLCVEAWAENENPLETS